MYHHLNQVFVFCFLVLSLVPVHAYGRAYKIATVAWIGWSPLHVAAEKGFWKEAGLDVEVVNFDDPIVILEAIKAKKIDLAMDMAGSVVGEVMAGEPLFILAETDWSNGGDKIVVQAGSRLEDHTGEVVGVFLQQPSCLYFLDCYLRTIDLKLSDFRIVEINPRDLNAQFIAGRLPAIVNYEPWVRMAVNVGHGRVLATSADFKGCIPECIFGYQNRIDRMPEKDICIILDGWIKAVRWLKKPENRNAYYRILRERTFQHELALSDEDLTQMLGNVAIHDISMLYERNRDAGGLWHFFESLNQSLKRNGLLRKSYNSSTIFRNRYILKVLEKYRRGNE